MATRTGLDLLSALRRTASIAAVREIPETFFVEEDELAGFRWLRDHVIQHRTFPDVRIFMRETGLQLLVTTQPLAYYKDLARQRALYNVAMPMFGEMRDAMEAQNPDALVQVARQIVQASAPYVASNSFVNLEDAVQQVVTDFEQAHSSFGAMRGITSGWSYVDTQTNGWQNDDLISIVGRIGVGKTYVMLRLAHSAWCAGHSVLFNTNELGVLQLARRLFGIHTRINPSLIRRGQLSTVIAGRLREFASAMSTGGAPFNIVAGGFRKSVETVGAVAEATQPDIVFADASYLLEPIKKRRGAEGRRETVSDTIEDLKRLGIDINRPIIQSVQFNRTAEQPRRTQGNNSNPTSHLTLAKIGETDVIGQSSSVVAGIAKGFPPRDIDTRWWSFMKGREGESGVFAFNYRFNPVNFDIISIGEQGATASPEQDLSHML